MDDDELREASIQATSNTNDTTGGITRTINALKLAVA